MELSIIQTGMHNAPPLAPLERLFAASDLWVAASRTSRSALAKKVVNDTGFFSRLDKGAASPRVDTMQKFARFFADEASWPDGRVPAEARVEVAAFCHVNGVSVSWGDPATGRGEAMSGSREEAA